MFLSNILRIFFCTFSFISLINTNAIPSLSNRWTNGVVPYIIDSSLAKTRSLIKEGMTEYETRSCIRFKELESPSGNYLNFFKCQGCYTYVGMDGGKQPLSLGDGCHNIGRILHEIGHALGFYNEDNRSDRDNYINIYWQNIQSSSEMEFQKLQAQQNTLYNNFDYNSIMIKGEYAFSKKYNLLKTMEDKNRIYNLTDPDLKQRLTESDIYRVNKLYNCP